MKEVMEQLQQLYSNNKSLDQWEQLGYEIIERDLIQKLLKLHDNKLELE
jgi:hypothetical protein